MIMYNEIINKTCSCQHKETNEILTDLSLIKEIKLAEKEMRKGKGISWEKVKRELHIKT